VSEGERRGQVRSWASGEVHIDVTSSVEVASAAAGGSERVGVGLEQ
jgi:hypothetical protein